jgi:cobyric acid synthase
VPVRGVMPFVDDLLLPEEDAASLRQRKVADVIVDIVIIRQPTPGQLRFSWATGDRAWRSRPLRVQFAGVPRTRPGDPAGSKATIPDLEWLVKRLYLDSFDATPS